MTLLAVDNLRVSFHTREGVVRAVDGISYTLNAGETLGIVGESGSGKSVSQYALLGLLPTPPARIEGGSACFQGNDLLRSTAAQLRRIRGRRMAMIFQDPMTALNPYMKVGAQLMEPLQVHGCCSRSEARERAEAALQAVGIQDVRKRMGMYPHAFSGGMRQRVMIAMALITEPAVLIADEPTTALDVTVQAQILSLMQRLQQDHGTAVTLITHDLGVVAETCDRVLVMYAGRIVEQASTADLFRQPRHPYTQALMKAMPAIHRGGEALYAIPGMPPDLAQPISGCAFAPRCAQATPACHTAFCALQPVDENHASACVRVQQGEI